MLKDLRQQFRVSTELYATLTCPAGETHTGQVSNLSLAGVEFQGSGSEGLFQAATKTRNSGDLAILQLDIPVCNGGQRSMPVVSRVVSVSEDSGSCRVGLEFADLASHDQIQLEHYLYTRFLEA